eukprot:scaffold397928_cov14-Prasinocladus_malaysianus.AAC.1
MSYGQAAEGKPAHIVDELYRALDELPCRACTVYTRTNILDCGMMIILVRGIMSQHDTRVPTTFIQYVIITKHYNATTVL